MEGAKVKTLLSALIIALTLASAGLVFAGGSSAQFLTLKATAEQQMDSFQAYYSDSVQPQFYENVMSQCVKASLSDERAFEMIIEIDNAGRVAQVIFDRDTAVTRCLLRPANAMKLKPPPTSPYLAHFAIRFTK